jgi:hypothetical protein
MSQTIFDARVANKFTQLRKSAKSRNKPFSLTLVDIARLLRRKRCAYTGIVLTDKLQTSPEQRTDRTIERIDPSLGYEPSNVVPVCRLANTMKEALLESKLYIEGDAHPLSCDFSFLLKFVKGVEKAGYKE